MKVRLGGYKKRGKRKINIEIEHFDTWSCDHNLALIILPLLIQLKATKHGIPNEFADVGGEKWGSQESFDFYQETHNECFDIGVKRWEETLDKMIWSFEQIAFDDYDKKYHHGDAKYDWIKSDIQYPNPLTGAMEPTYQMVDKNPEEHWYDHVGHKLHEERIQEGINLFAKYFRALWD